MSKDGVLECTLTEVFTAMLLFHTIPVTSVGAERSFSKLKIIKNYEEYYGPSSTPTFITNSNRKQSRIKFRFNRSH